MRWLADECIAAALVAWLRGAGHDVLYIAEAAAGTSDSEVIALAMAENRLLLTDDKDFGDLIFRGQNSVSGAVLMRIDPDKADFRKMRLAGAIERYGDELFGRYTVVEEGRFRSRHLWSGL